MFTLKPIKMNRLVILFLLTVLSVNGQDSINNNVGYVLKYTYLYNTPEVSHTRFTALHKGDTLNFIDYNEKGFFKVLLNNKKEGFVSAKERLYTINNFCLNKHLSHTKRKDSIKIIEQKEKLKKEKEDLENEINDYKSNCHYELNEVDEFTGKKKTITMFYNIESFYGGLGLEVKLSKIDNKKYIYFRLYKDLGCSSPYKSDWSNVKIKLRNNTIITIYHRGDVDCGDSFNLIGYLTNSDIVKLKSSEIKTIRFTGTDYYHDIKEIDWRTFFKDKLKCVK